jgi:hypothetical protein
VSGRRNGPVRSEDGIGEFEEGVSPAMEAFVERAAEGLESIGRFHDALIMHPPTAPRTPYLLVGLKRKLRYPPLFFYQTCSRPSSVSRPSLDARGFAVWHPSCVSHGSLRKQFEEGGKHVGTE